MTLLAFATAADTFACRGKYDGCQTWLPEEVQHIDVQNCAVVLDQRTHTYTQMKN